MSIIPSLPAALVSNPRKPVLGTLVVWASCNPRTNFFIQITAEIGLAYYSVSVFLNATLTSMICYRLVCHARDVKEYLGDKYASPYFTMITLLVESILPYTLSAIAFLVLFGVKNRAAIAFFRVYVLMTVRFGALFRASTNGADRFVVCNATDADLARGTRNGMAKRVDRSATIGDQAFSERWNYVALRTSEWGKARGVNVACPQLLIDLCKRVNLVIISVCGCLEACARPSTYGAPHL